MCGIHLLAEVTTENALSDSPPQDARARFPCSERAAGRTARIVIAGVARLWQTALELLMAGIGWLALKYGRPAEHDSTTPTPVREGPRAERPPIAVSAAAPVTPCSREGP